jgi:hypothetical protein
MHLGPNMRKMPKIGKIAKMAKMAKKAIFSKKPDFGHFCHFGKTSKNPHFWSKMGVFGTF